jgi:hypothetical protein
MSVYLLHLHPSYKQARHYLGFAEDVAPRVYAHLHGRGARLTEVALSAGCEMILVRIWDGASRTDERKLKNLKNAPKLCPICQGLALQLPLLRGECAYVPKPEVDENLSPMGDILPTNDAQLTLDDFHLEVRAAELEDADLGWSELAEYLDEQERLWFAERGIDIEGELDDLREGIEDEAFWSRGQW